MLENMEQSLRWLTSLHKFGIKLGLEQTRRLAELCGNPDRDLRFIHLAGTNGKGSTGAMLERALRGSGWKTGFHSSPHLISVCERFRINGCAVSEREFIRQANVVKKAAETMAAAGASVTYFEATTVMAMLMFKEHNCDYVIWETGMGGRLDSTNIVQPVISVITGIALDHEKFLGSTVADIAGEKAGIIKVGVPVVTGELPDAAERVISQRAAEQKSAYFKAAEVAPLEGGTELIEPGYQCFKCGGETIELTLNGVMQQRNAQLAIAVLKILKLWNPECRMALKQTRWPGRIELLQNGRFIVDGGHNPDGLQALCEALRTIYPGRQFNWIFGAFADKDFLGGLRLIAPLVKRLQAVGFAEESRLSAAPEKICQAAGELGIKDCSVIKDLPAYLKNAAAPEADDAVPVIIAGSLYLAGEVLEVLQTPEKVLNL